MDSTELISAWNAVAKNKCSQGRHLAVSHAVSEFLSRYPGFEENDIIEAVSNYDRALKVKNTLAWEHTLLMWLRKGTAYSYLPGVFNIKNYDPTNFTGRKQGTAAELLNDK